MGCLLGWGPTRALGSWPVRAWEELLKTSPVMGTAWALVSHWDGVPFGGKAAVLSVADHGT